MTATAQEILGEQRKRVAEWLTFFTTLFMRLALAGALVTAAYGLSAGTHRPVADAWRAPGAATAGAPKGAPKPYTSDRTPIERPTAALLALAIAGAAAATGGALGFLFGLPRSLTSGEVRTAQAGAAEAADSADPASKGGAIAGAVKGGADHRAGTGTLATNTNLEQISDWLTKIIVGVGITKLDTLPEAVEAFGDRTDAFFGFGGKVFGIAGGIYFLVVGFFIGYVLTRTKLTWIFIGSAGEAGIIDHVFKAGLPEALNASGEQPVDPATVPLPSAKATSQGPPSTTPQNVVDADRTVIATPLSSLNSGEELAARAAAEARAGQLQLAASLYQQVVRENPTSRHLSDYAGVLGLSGDVAAGSDVLATIRTVAPGKFNESARKLWTGLLRSGLYNGRYDTAIDAGEQLLATSPGAGDTWTRLWLACAYGQKLKALAGGDEAEPTIRSRIVILLGQVLAADPGMKSLVDSLYDPAKQRGDDDDLQALWPDPDVDRLLARPTETGKPAVSPTSIEN